MKLADFTVYRFPRNGYSAVEAVQQIVTSRSIRGSRVVLGLFAGFLAAFVMGAVAGLLGYPLIAVAVIPLGFVLPCAALFFLRTPALQCSTCGRTMKKALATIDSKPRRQGLFLVCESCQRYAYTHKAGRP